MNIVIVVKRVKQSIKDNLGKRENRIQSTGNVGNGILYFSSFKG